MSSMFNPPHPGLTLRDDILPTLDLQVPEEIAPNSDGVASAETTGSES